MTRSKDEIERDVCKPDIAAFFDEQMRVYQNVVFWSGKLSKINERDRMNSGSRLPIFHGTVKQFVVGANTRLRTLREYGEKYGGNAAEDLVVLYPIPKVQFEGGGIYNPKFFNFGPGMIIASRNVTFYDESQPRQIVEEQVKNAISTDQWTYEHVNMFNPIIFWVGQLKNSVRRDGTDDINQTPFYQGSSKEFIHKLHARQCALDAYAKLYGLKAASELARNYRVPSVRFQTPLDH